ncbi:MAG: heavy-metal-associated domain-containing protein [Clostridia bacterium]|nr:heavy-metal-associated domain-containing protein [Clostridia bacterium]
MKKEIKIDGMHCEHCAASVEKALSSLEGVKKVKVKLQKGIAKLDGEVSDEAIKTAVTEAGFTVTGIE